MASHYGGARYPAGELEGLTDGSYCGTLARVRVVSDAKYGYNNCIETRCEIVLKKNTIYILPTFTPAFSELSEYSEKYLQKRARKAAK